MTPRPSGARWANAKLFHVYLKNPAFPVCGLHLVWAVVGHKHVRCCLPIQWDKWRMGRATWDDITDKKEFVR